MDSPNTTNSAGFDNYLKRLNYKAQIALEKSSADNTYLDLESVTLENYLQKVKFKKTELLSKAVQIQLVIITGKNSNFMIFYNLENITLETRTIHQIIEESVSAVVWENFLLQS